MVAPAAVALRDAIAAEAQADLEAGSDADPFAVSSHEIFVGMDNNQE